MLKKLLIIILFAFTINILAQDNIDFSAEDLEGNEIQFSNFYKQGPTLINFWALWCKPCRAEMKHLDALYNKYKKYGFTILAVNQDSPRSVAKVNAYVTSHELSFPVLTDPDNEIFQQFNGQSIPLNLLYNNNGEVIYSHIGYLPGDELELEKAIKKSLELKID